MGMPKPCSAGATPPNPNPSHFSVMQQAVIGDTVVALVRYPDCTTYGGLKLLVYDCRERFEQQLLGGELDPHFLETSYSPIARFVPTEDGWRLAMAVAQALAVAHSMGGNSPL